MDIYFIGDDPLIPYSSNIKTATIKEAYDYLKDKKVLGLDIETTQKFGGKYLDEGLDPYVSEIVMFQIGDEHKQFIIDYRVVKNLNELRLLLIDPEIIKVGHNIKFEYKHIYVNTGLKLVNVYDTMIAEQVLYNGFNYPMGLKNLMERYLKKEVDKSIRLEFLKIEDRPFTEAQITYGAEDILNPILIRELQQERIIQEKLTPCIRLEMLFLLVLGDIEVKGLHFDKNQWLAIATKAEAKYLYLKNELDLHVVKHFYNSKFISKQIDMFDPEEQKCVIQWTSSKQVIEFLVSQNACPLETSKSTGKLSYTVNAGILKNYVRLNKHIMPSNLLDFFEIYEQFKETEQKCTTFGRDFLKYINPITKRLHSNYRQILNTGRISSSNPNLQNIPSDVDYRKCFSNPAGCKIVNADYSGQEQIILVNKSREKNLIKFYDSGDDDMHSFIAREIFSEIPNTLSLSDVKQDFPDHRQKAKAAGFAINYGGNGYTISKNLGVSQEIGDRVYDSYFKAFPDLLKYFTKVQNETIKNGFILIDPITNRKSYFDKRVVNINKIKRAALNFPIQGEAGSITKLAAIFFRQDIIKVGLSNHIYITNIVHDEINVECLETYATYAKSCLEEAMYRAGALWCKKVPLKATAVIGTYWGH